MLGEQITQAELAAAHLAAQTGVVRYADTAQSGRTQVRWPKVGFRVGVGIELGFLITNQDWPVQLRLVRLAN